MRILFVQLDLPWPIRSGWQLRSYHMMRTLAANGNIVRLLCPKNDSILPPLSERRWEFKELIKEADDTIYDKHLNWLGKKWLSFWGIDNWIPSSVVRGVESFKADVIIGVGLRILPLLSVIRDKPTIWYAADEWVLHYLSLLKEPKTTSRGKLLHAVLHSFLYERSFTPKISGVVLVSPLDKWGMKWIGGAKKVACIPNGVDMGYFQPSLKPQKPNTIIFWGRMDFEPNIDAVLWFYNDVFRILRDKFTEAQFTIVGAYPTKEVLGLGQKPGVKVLGEVDDIRPFVWDSACVVMPIRTGYGIKNKLLEAAVLGKAIIASKRSINAIKIKECDAPWLIANTRKDWIQSVELLWNDEKKRAELGKNARRWIIENHSWDTAAQSLSEFIIKCKEDSHV